MTKEEKKDLLIKMLLSRRTDTWRSICDKHIEADTCLEEIKMITTDGDIVRKINEVIDLIGLAAEDWSSICDKIYDLRKKIELLETDIDNHDVVIDNKDRKIKYLEDKIIELTKHQLDY